MRLPWLIGVDLAMRRLFSHSTFFPLFLVTLQHRFGYLGTAFVQLHWRIGAVLATVWVAVAWDNRMPFRYPELSSDISGGPGIFFALPKLLA